MWQKKVHLVEYPFTDIAIEIGNIRVANMVALGCFIGSRKIVSEKSVIETIHAIAPLDKRNLIMINEKALSSGMQLIKHKNDKS
jgi:2-oxoglutarate ferredoxin oxidoreductase subunit gamma